MASTHQPKAQRSDALRSRGLLLGAAAEAFAADESPTFKDIAERAGVGIATMFRHFPTREALVEAVYRSELETLCESAAHLGERRPPIEALRVWMIRWARFVVTKRGMADVLQGMVAQGVVTKSATAILLTQAVETILAAGRRDGSLRADVAAEDVIAALSGILVVAGAAGQETQAHRLIDLLMDGLVSSSWRR